MHALILDLNSYFFGAQFAKRFETLHVFSLEHREFDGATVAVSCRHVADSEAYTPIGQ